MTTFEIKISAPELAAAINALAEAVSSRAVATTALSSKFPPVTDAPEKAKETAATEPEEPATDTPITVEQVRAKLAELTKAGKQAKAKEIITSYGAKKLSDVPLEKYAEVITKATEALQ